MQQYSFTVEQVSNYYKKKNAEKKALEELKNQEFDLDAIQYAQDEARRNRNPFRNKQ